MAKRRGTQSHEGHDDSKLLDELGVMAARGLVSLRLDEQSELRVALGPRMREAAVASRVVQGASLLERMHELNAAGAEELYA
jgi:hypothetical protein